MAEQELETGEEKKSSKLLIIIIIVLLLIIAGGAGAWFFMGSNDSAPTEDDEAVEQVEEKPEQEEEPASNELYYYDMEQPLRVNFPKGSVASLIEVRVAFMVKDEDTQEAMEKHQPMIVNNMLMAISAAGAEGLRSKEGKDALRQTMLDETGKVMEKMTGRNRVKEIFFTAFVMQ